MGAKVQVSKSWEILGFFLQAGKEKRGEYMLRTKKIHFSENQSGIRKGRLWENVYMSKAKSTKHFCFPLLITLDKLA